MITDLEDIADQAMGCLLPAVLLIVLSVLGAFAILLWKLVLFG
jgi:hypothetical protein